ncbi:lysine transporter LysE [Jannaschia pagri]|uniref:Lysine transporter LysE n=1 Tax=Jannaschia pagri TaxID=2829797 RepID=A0ABQ4NKQ5_9RHOB|nr:MULTISPECIES: LysE family translocator [unclassified Jannaschia]GIT91173.1 lysine transporter LysE [Jannaschia sp. AI_61]GIT95005.1 lysine transporter LysE [Jannaschia sp. AI_62]
MDMTVWLTFVAASVALLMIPGPTILLVMSYALSQGRRVAVASAGGVALGDAVAMGASLAGLGALVLASATLFTVLKWIGAAYLVWMGWKLWRSAGAMTLGEVATEGEVTPRAVFGHAAVVTALNPKSIVFFIAFVPQFIDPNAALGPQFAILIATFVGLATLNALAYALLAARLRDGLRRPSVLRAMGRLGGAALMAMGAATALTRRTTA